MKNYNKVLKTSLVVAALLMLTACGHRLDNNHNQNLEPHRETNSVERENEIPRETATPEHRNNDKVHENTVNNDTPNSLNGVHNNGTHNNGTHNNIHDNVNGNHLNNGIEQIHGDNHHEGTILEDGVNTGVNPMRTHRHNTGIVR